MKQARVTPTPRATTREVYISVSAKPGTKGMVLNVKVKYHKIWGFSLKYLTKYYTLAFIKKGTYLFLLIVLQFIAIVFSCFEANRIHKGTGSFSLPIAFVHQEMNVIRGIKGVLVSLGKMVHRTRALDTRLYYLTLMVNSSGLTCTEHVTCDWQITWLAQCQCVNTTYFPLPTKIKFQFLRRSGNSSS